MRPAGKALFPRCTATTATVHGRTSVEPGWLDGVREIGLPPWGMAAGTLLITEAGGLVGDPGDQTTNFRQHARLKHAGTITVDRMCMREIAIANETAQRDFTEELDGKTPARTSGTVIHSK